MVDCIFATVLVATRSQVVQLVVEVVGRECLSRTVVVVEGHWVSSGRSPLAEDTTEIG